MHVSRGIPRCNQIHYLGRFTFCFVIRTYSINSSEESCTLEGSLTNGNYVAGHDLCTFCNTKTQTTHLSNEVVICQVKLSPFTDYNTGASKSNYCGIL